MQADRTLAMWDQPKTQNPDLLLQKSYWLRRFRLPIDHCRMTAHLRSEAGICQSKEYIFAVPATAQELLLTSTRGSIDSIYALCLTALSLVLSAHTRSTEIVIATLARAGFQTPCDEAIPLRIAVQQNERVTELRRQIAEEVAAAYEHSEVCVAAVLRTLEFPSMDGTPVYPVLAGMTEIHSPCGLDRYGSDLSFRFNFGASNSGGQIEYDSSVYEEAWIRCLADQWISSLEDILDRPLVKAAEIRLQRSNQSPPSHLSLPTISAFQFERSIFQRFAENAEHMSDRIAATHGSESITYRQLYLWATHLAEAFLETGATRDTSIAILMPRGIGMLAAMLASLSISSPYVLVDPELPLNRIQYFLSNFSPIAVVTSAVCKREFASLINQIGSVKAILSPERPVEDREQRSATPGLACSGWAYIVYTSGSTGTPKGAIVRQDGALNHMLGEIEALSLNLDLKFLQSAPSSSDIIMWQFLTPLLVGGRTVIADRSTVLDPKSLFEELKRTEVTLVELVPGTLLDFLDYVENLPTEQRKLTQLKKMMVTGEATDVSVFNRWFSVYPNVPLINCFGPAEASDDVSQFMATGPLDACRMRVPVGIPLPNLQVHVLDRSGEMAALSVPGEIYIGGIAVGDGYWSDAKRTAEFFLCDPFSQQPGSRMYRTGDLGRWLPDGNLEFLGRVDNQIKIRGNRVQPDEIEAALAVEPCVRRAVVGTIKDHSGQQSLVAWIALREISDSEELEGSVSEQIFQWQTVFENTYSRRSRQANQTFNITGWNSSYTGMPIPAAEMREWVDLTLQRIRALLPKRILEIGCGTGLLLLQLAPQSEFYVGTDFSAKAIGHVSNQVKQLGLDASRIDLSVRAADDFTGIKDHHFDTVILNSIIQYFPDENYLMRVLRGVVKKLSPGGSIFVGDVRSLPLLTMHHLSVEIRRASPQMELEQFLHLVKNAVSREEELVVHPHLFIGLPSKIPEISSVSVLAKRGVSQNEMTKFRYDAVLRTEPSLRGDARPASVQWTDNLQISDLLSLLTDATPTGNALITNVPNARLYSERQLASFLEKENAPKTVGQLRDELAKTRGAVGWDPEDLWMEAIAQRLDLNWLQETAGGCFDLFISSAGKGCELSMTNIAGATPERLTNQPLSGRFFAHVVPKLRECLTQKLPSYMIPSYFVHIDSVPLTASGKVDIRVLPRPEMTRREMRQAYVAPQSPVQTILTGIWSDLLGIPRIGVRDNFFELGGHSLLATQVISRIRKVFEIDLSLRNLFERPTIQALSSLIEEQDAYRKERSTKIAEILLQVQTKN